MADSDDNAKMVLRRGGVGLGKRFKVNPIVGEKRHLVGYRVAELVRIIGSQVPCVSPRYRDVAAGTEQSGDQDIHVLV
jgi:hypothetical protein